MKRSAFTMMELMIAMGILAVGMAMSASLFPTAAKEANTAIGSAMGQTIAENGLAMGQLAFRSDKHSGSGARKVSKTTFDTGAATGSGDASFLGAENQGYPLGTNGKYGFALLARKVSDGAYQIVSTAYRRQDTSTNVAWYSVEFTGGTTTEVTITPAASDSSSVDAGSQVYVNSPFVLSESGRIATVIAQDEKTLTLDRKIEISGTTALFLRETGAVRSPAIYTMTVTTALDE
jgi:prepilin-type N-terminal cleavage/methylation domain-containing protein